MMGIRTPPESGYALFTDNPVNAVEHCLQASVKVGMQETVLSMLSQIRDTEYQLPANEIVPFSASNFEQHQIRA